MTMRVCFVARNDFETKPGGDTVQFQMYSRAVEAGGGTVAFIDGILAKAANHFASFGRFARQSWCPKRKSR